MNACVPPIISEAVEGVIVIVVNTGGDNVITVTVAVPLTDPLSAVITAVPLA